MLNIQYPKQVLQLTPSPKGKTMQDIFHNDTYMIRRKILALPGRGKFHIYDPQGNLIFFSRQTALLKEDIRVYTDETMSREVLRIHAREIIDFSTPFDVTDVQENKKVGAIKREGWTSLLQDCWEFLDTKDEIIAILKEDNLCMAVFRRLVTGLLPQTYYARKKEKRGEEETREGECLAVYKQNFNPLVLKLRVHIIKKKRILDPRLILAAGILLVAIEGRQ